jgi:hypothetical protein
MPASHKQPHKQSHKLTLLAGVALLVAGCATSTSSDTQDLADTAGKTVRECRYSESTGSNMRKRICASQEEWAAYDAAEQEEDTDDFFRRSREGGAAAGNVEQPAIGGF